MGAAAVVANSAAALGSALLGAAGAGAALALPAAACLDTSNAEAPLRAATGGDFAPGAGSESESEPDVLP